MTTRKQLELDRYLKSMLGKNAACGYHSRGAVVQSQGSTLLAKGTISIPDSSRKAGLGDRN